MCEGWAGAEREQLAGIPLLFAVMLIGKLAVLLHNATLQVQLSYENLDVITNDTVFIPTAAGA